MVNNKTFLFLVLVIIVGLMSSFAGREAKSQEKLSDNAYWSERVKVPRWFLLEMYLNSSYRHRCIVDPVMLGRYFIVSPREKKVLICMTFRKNISYNDVEHFKKKARESVELCIKMLGLRSMKIEFKIRSY